MDLNSLAVVLQAALSPNPDERKAAEQTLDQVLLFLHSFPVHSSFYFSVLLWLWLSLIDDEEIGVVVVVVVVVRSSTRLSIW